MSTQLYITVLLKLENKMKKKILIALLLAATLSALTGCYETNTNINIDSDNENAVMQVGIGQLKKINKGYLYYDATTNIVYFWNGKISSEYSSTAPSPYYAPNGLPYKYNPSTNTLEEIALEEY